MPPRKVPITKQYSVLLKSSDGNSRVSPQAPDRVFVYMKNTGENFALLRLGDDVRDDGGNVILAPGEFVQWDNPMTTPREAINLMSPLGTTIAVIEGIL